MDAERKKLILIADDDYDFRDSLKANLGAAGFDVVEARDGKETLEESKKNLPDLVLLDINMPGGPSGIETALQLKEIPETKNIKIIFLSGVDNPWPAFGGTKQEVSKELGMADFFVKTGDFGELVKKIQNVLENN